MQCAAGYYSDESTLTLPDQCKQCAAGNYSDDLGQTLCKQCAEGQYLDEVAQTSCKTCRAGTYSSTRGRSTSCLECPPGTHLVDQNTPTSHDHETDCKECPVLTYNPLEGHGDACFQCPSATVQGSTTCAGCDPGQYKHEGEGGNASCVDCERGQYTDTRNQDSCAMQEWQLCTREWHVMHTLSPGRHGTDTDTPVTVDVACFNCTEGTLRQGRSSEQCGLHILPQRSLER